MICIGRPSKTYRLDNGEKITAEELSQKIKIPINVARVRLCTYSSPAQIYAPIGGLNKAKKDKPKTKKKPIKPIDDPMFKLALKSI